MNPPEDLQSLLPFIAAVSFGIQQVLQVLVDPLASAFITVVKERKGVKLPDGTKSLPKGIADADAKKAFLGLTSFILGLLIVNSANSVSDGSLMILRKAGFELPFWDVFITALTISAGSEGVNSVVKLVQYVKDAVKTKTSADVSQGSPLPVHTVDT